MVHFIMASKRASYTYTFKLKFVEDRAAAIEYRVKEKQVRDCMETRKRHPDYYHLECGLY